MAILVATSPVSGTRFVEALRRVAPDITVWSEDDTPPPEAVEAILAWRMKPGVLPRYPNLRVLSSIGAGVDKLLAAPDLPPEVHVTRVVDSQQARLIAQYVVMQTLCFTRERARYAAQQASAEWIRHRARPLEQCRVGILGMGQVGHSIAAAFAPLGLPLAAWTRRGHDLPGVLNFVGDASLPDLLAQSDILVCAVALTASTRGLLNRATLSQLPQGAFVINVGRGEHLVEADLHALIDEDHLAGAALDVFEREPPQLDNWVWRHPLVVATPHIAGEVSADETARQCVASLLSARAGERPANAVDRNAGY
jgi:D-3-phosphoglycerate dehydrogenase/glyoxylate/hydroxypyruvate reductase A